MKLLLDTPTSLWWWGDDPLLSATARKAIANEANTVLLSAASAPGKLRLSIDPAFKEFRTKILW